MKTPIYTDEIQEIIEAHTINMTDQATKKVIAEKTARQIQDKIRSRMNGDEIKPGSVVKLASGGPMKMTVESIQAGGDKAWITWFAGEELKTHLIDKAALVLCEDKESN